MHAHDFSQTRFTGFEARFAGRVCAAAHAEQQKGQAAAQRMGHGGHRPSVVTGVGTPPSGVEVRLNEQVAPLQSLLWRQKRWHFPEMQP